MNQTSNPSARTVMTSRQPTTSDTSAAQARHQMVRQSIPNIIGTPQPNVGEGEGRKDRLAQEETARVPSFHHQE